MFSNNNLCNILNKEDNGIVLEKMRMFRDNVLQKNKQCIDILKDYDNIRPVIAQCMILDKNKIKLANGLYPILEDITKKIDDKNYEQAITNYQVMALSLINYYNLKHTFNNLKDNNYFLYSFNRKHQDMEKYIPKRY